MPCRCPFPSLESLCEHVADILLTSSSPLGTRQRRQVALLRGVLRLGVNDRAKQPQYERLAEPGAGAEVDFAL